MRVMDYSVKPEIKHKPKGGEEKFKVWEAGGRVLATTTKDDAELIVRALNRDKLFEEMEAELKNWQTFFLEEGYQCNCECAEFCPYCNTEDIFTKIDALEVKS